MTPTVDAPDEPALAADAQSFLEKYQARWPEWRVAEVFLLPEQRPLALAWASLHQEFADAAWGGSDPRPGEAKLLWWQEELLGWTQGRRRHPLGALLQRHAADWAALATAVTALSATRARANDPEHAAMQLDAMARAVARVEQSLFPADHAAGLASADAVQIVAAQWLYERLSRQGEAAVPLTLLARSGAGPALPVWRAELAQRWPKGQALSRPRRLWSALAYGRLLGPDERPLPPWRALWLAWRAARRATGLFKSGPVE